MKMPTNISLEEAERKVRKVLPAKRGPTINNCQISLPLCYLNKKVRVIVIEEEEVKNEN